MKRLVLFFFVTLLAFVLLLTSCDGKKIINNNNPPSEPSYGTDYTPYTQDTTDVADPDDSKIKIDVSVNGKVFTAVLEDNVTAQKFLAMLPMTVEMTELNENEKYVYLDTSISASPQHYGSIRKGDIMLYGDNCLVLFYESFQTVYSYTRIGRIIDVSALNDALGTGDVTVTFAP